MNGPGGSRSAAGSSPPRSPPASSGSPSTRRTMGPPSGPTSAGASTRTSGMARVNFPAGDADIGGLKLRAANLRRHMLAMARGPGQGYIGQGLGIADLLAAL